MGRSWNRGDGVEAILPLLWHVPTVMVVLLVAGLMMGQRHVGELSVFDLLTGIAIGAVAGAGIADPTAPHVGILLAILALASLHYLVTWLTVKWRWFGRLTTFEPLVVVRKGQPVRAAMQRVRLAVSDLMPLLRERDVFDLNEVEYAVLEPDGKITVLRRSDPQVGQGWRRAVLVDGEIDFKVLREAGWDEARLRRELAAQGHSDPRTLFLVTLDEQGNLHLIPRDLQDEGPTVHH